VINIKIYLTNLGRYNEGELVGLWLSLPYTNEELETALKRIGIGAHYEEYFITDYENDLGLEIGEYENLSALNDVAKCVSGLDVHSLQVLRAVIELESLDVSDVLEVIANLDDYTLLTDIQSDYDLGHYYIHELEDWNLDGVSKLVEYFDYSAYGRDIRLNSVGGHTSYGWLVQ